MAYNHIPQRPLITKVGQVHAARPQPSSTNLNDWVEPGIFKFNGNVVSLTNLPNLSDKSGHIQITTDYTSEATALANKTIRQIVYPDSVSEATPYTRVCNNGSWSIWGSLGGGMSRVKLTSNRTASVNTFYYSFNGYTLTLPNPSSYILGTTVVLEQCLNHGTVVYGSSSTTTTPDYEIDEDGQISSNIIGSTIYKFEVSEDDAGTKEWVMEVGSNVADLFASMSAAINEKLIVKEREHRIQVTSASMTSAQIGAMLVNYNPVIQVVGELTDPLTFVLPDPSLFNESAKVTFEFLTTGSFTIEQGEYNKSLTVANGLFVILPFQVSYIGPTTKAWTLLVK